jgi:hypothetical protein
MTASSHDHRALCSKVSADMRRMPSQRPPWAVLGRAAGCIAALLVAASLGGCGSMIADMPLVGEPARTPPRPAVRPDYLSVNEPTTKRNTTPLTTTERAQAEADLVKDRAQAAQEKRQQINQDR